MYEAREYSHTFTGVSSCNLVSNVYSFHHIGAWGAGTNAFYDNSDSFSSPSSLMAPGFDVPLTTNLLLPDDFVCAFILHKGLSDLAT